MSLMRRILALAAVAAILVVGVVSVAGAQAGTDPTATDAQRLEQIVGNLLDSRRLDNTAPLAPNHGLGAHRTACCQPRVGTSGSIAAVEPAAE